MTNKQKSYPANPNQFSDTIKAQDDIDKIDLIPDNEEYYTLDLSRGTLDENDPTESDLSESDSKSIEAQGTNVTKSSSFYDGQVVQSQNGDSDGNTNTDLGGVIDEKMVTDEDTISAQVGMPGGQGIDDDAG